MKGYGPADPLQTPRFAGISTFLRLPHTLHLDGVDVAFVGLPFDTGVSFRAGARFGPKAIREGSLSLRPAYNMAQRVAVFDQVSAVDYGDAGVVPGFIERSYERMAATLREICEAGRRADRLRRRPQRAARRAARRGRHARPRRAAAVRRALGHVGRVLRREVHARHRRSAAPGRRG